MIGEAPQGGGKAVVCKPLGACAQRAGRSAIQLFCNVFVCSPGGRTGLHADLYSSKFPPRTLKYVKQVRSALPKQTGGGAGLGDEDQLGQAGVSYPDMGGKSRRQAVLDPLHNGEFALATVQKLGEGRFGRKYLSQRAHDCTSLAP